MVSRGASATPNGREATRLFANSLRLPLSPRRKRLPLTVGIKGVIRYSVRTRRSPTDIGLISPIFAHNGKLLDTPAKVADELKVLSDKAN